MKISILLPYKENYTDNYAGAVSLFINDTVKLSKFKKDTNFENQCEWKIKLQQNYYLINVYGKLIGKANTENKYDFPPPIDNKLFFGSCIIVCKLKVNNTYEYNDLTIELWNKLYEKLFGGFEDLSTSLIEDELEKDLLKDVPQEFKTKDGYLKDDFVVDDSNSSDLNSIDSEDNEDEFISDTELNYEDYLTDDDA